MKLLILEALVFYCYFSPYFYLNVCGSFLLSFLDGRLSDICVAFQHSLLFTLMFLFLFYLPETTKTNSSSFQSPGVSDAMSEATTVASCQPTSSLLLYLKLIRRTCADAPEYIKALNNTFMRADVKMNHFCLCHHFLMWQLLVHLLFFA